MQQRDGETNPGCWSPAAVERMRSGDEAAVLNGIATLVRAWAAQAGVPEFIDTMLPGSAVSASGGQRQGLLLAAHDLMTVLSQSPQGRKALADLRLQPLFQQVDGERRAGS